MAMPNLDPRSGGACGTCMAKKFFSVVVGYVQLVFWILGFLTLVFRPSYVFSIVKNLDTTALVIAAFISLLCIALTVVLLIGLHKNRRLYVKAYCVFVVVYLVMLVISFVVNLFLHPQNIGFQGFFSLVFCFLLNLMFFFVVRSYYLITYCNSPNQLVINQPKV